MATENYFIADFYLEQQIASAPTEAFPQNYWRIQDAPSLAEELIPFAECMSSGSPATSPVVFPGWERTALPNEYGHEWRRVIYEQGMYVAAAVGADAGNAPGMIATSLDGIEWTLQTTPRGADVELETIIWADGLGLFLAGGYDTTFGDHTVHLMTSPDAITWTARTSPVITNIIRKLAWSESLGLLIASNWEGDVWAYSSDGINWTQIVDYADYGWTDVAWAESLSLFVGVGAFQGISVSSPDGINWTEHIMVDKNYFELEWSEELSLFVAFAEMDLFREPFTTSPDGINWTNRSLNFVVVTNDTSRFLPVWGLRWDSISSKFFAISEGDENWPNFFTTPSLYLIESSDGITWDITPDMPGMHDYGYPVLNTSEFRDIAFKSATERVILGKFGGFYYTGT